MMTKEDFRDVLILTELRAVKNIFLHTGFDNNDDISIAYTHVIRQIMEYEKKLGELK